MSEANEDAGRDKAMAFFQRAEEIAATQNFDYAIDMYLQGLRHWPDALQDGHFALRQLALVRQGKGGKTPSVVEKVKRHGGKSPLEEMLNAEYLLSRDPDNNSYAEAMLKACAAGGYSETAEWIAQIVFEGNRSRKKPALSTYLLLKDSYASLEMFSEAIVACQHALELKPHDGVLQTNLRDLSAQMTVKKGRYGQEGDFRQSILDRKKQERLQAQDNVIKTIEFREEIAKEARKAFAMNPKSAVNIVKLAKALFDLETDDACREALVILQEAHAESKDFSFKRLEGKLRIKKLQSEVRKATADVEAEPENENLKQELDSKAAEFDEMELAHYRLCVANYPTDLHLKYEYGIRLIKNKEYDEAIPLLQDAQRDPRHKLWALNKTGLCFFFKGWFEDAIDIFNRALESSEIKNSVISKDIRYNLARSYEEKGQKDEALELYRKLAQLDFNYKDVRQRIEELRKLNEQ